MNIVVPLKSTLFCALILLLSNASYAQTLASYKKAAQEAMQVEDYNAALLYLQKALEINPNATDSQYAYAEVARNFNALEVAESYYQKVIESNEKLNFPKAYFGLAMVQKQMGKYDIAIKNFNNYINVKGLNKDKTVISSAKKNLKDCQWAINIEFTDTIKVAALDKKVNTPYSEFAPYLSNDSLYYSSFRFVNKADEHDPPRRITKILTSVKGSKGRTLRSGFNVVEKHTAHTAFSSDRRRFYFTLCDFKAGAQINCNIYYRERDKRGRWQKKAKALPKFINSDKFTSTQPTIAYDSLRAKDVLIYSSTRTGGKGKSDLWLTEINGKNFSKPINLENLNTTEDELTPFFHQKSQTLYFSSDGYKNLGGYDIYAATKDSLTWTNPQHLAKPINSSYNDLYFFLDSNTQKGYLSSNRLGSQFLDRSNKTCCNDIYKVDFISDTIPDKPKDKIVIVEKPPVVPIPVKPKEPETLEDFEPFALYFDNDEPDKRTRRTVTKKNYETTFYTYFDRRQEYIREYSLPLKEEDRYEAEALMDDFFVGEVKHGYEYLFKFSDILLKRLAEGEKVEIFVKGYTSPRAQSDYNVNLGKRRISSVRNHFSTYQAGILQPFLNSGMLKITERSFGETTAASGVSDDLDDVRNSVYSIGAAKERRVEIVEIKVN